MTRVISGVVLALLALGIIAFVPVFGLRVIALCVVVLAIHELLPIAAASGASISPVVTYAFALLVAGCMSVTPARALVIVIAALLVLGVEVLGRARGLGHAAAGLAAGLYVGVPLGSLVAIRELGGREAVLLLIAVVAISDTAQYYCGRAFGRRLLAPAISPKKTIEGAVGGVLIGGAAFVAGSRSVLPFAPVSTVTVAAAAIVVTGICGDLFESRLKRLAGVKDSSGLIPGHGGVLDRLDALLGATPVFYLFLQWVM